LPPIKLRPQEFEQLRELKKTVEKKWCKPNCGYTDVICFLLSYYKNSKNGQERV
jgi:hypothetical protein